MYLSYTQIQVNKLNRKISMIKMWKKSEDVKKKRKYNNKIKYTFHR